MSQATLAPNVRLDDDNTRVRPIDLVHLARQSLGDRDLEMEILGMFDHLLESHVSILNNTPTKTEIAHSLHALKGASAGVGAKSVAAHAASFEKAFQSTDNLDAEMLADLDVVVLETRTFIAHLLAD